ncbi:hypothetical protein AB3X91_37765 [Paraburkholderia sp. BR14263]|uniref:hypothetical protein n=1 Tax=unclassified Paraburkholderia TaxID=2615204 RepID=UPI0034CD5ED8
MNMRHAAIAAVMLASSASALAYGESWSNVNNELETCKVYGQMGDLYWRMAEQGRRPTRHDEDWIEPVRQHIEDEIFDHHDAYSQESVASFAFAYCMDRVPPLIRARKATMGG